MRFESIFILFFVLGFDVSRGEIVLDKGQPRVDTEYGTVYGSVETLKSKKEIYTFKGIPFAAAPVGQLRFEEPRPVTAFGTVNGTVFGPGCVNFASKAAFKGQEDCLYLNFIVPATPTRGAKRYPVLVLIVGGGHLHSDVVNYHNDHFHEHFVTKGLIYASFHYRPGPLGYYSNGTYPSSNVALFDEQEALRFIQKIVSAFNGDPKRVTIFGFSAGGMTASLLSFSHRSQGLFQQAIIFCGNGHRISSRGKRNFESSRELEAKLGCSGAENVLQCMKNTDIADLWRIDTSDSFSPMQDQLEYTRWAPMFQNKDFQIGDSFDEALFTAPNVVALYGSNTLDDTIACIQKVAPPGTRFHPLNDSQALSFTRDDFVAAVTYVLTQENGWGVHTPAAIDEIIAFYDSEMGTNPDHAGIQIYVQFFSDIRYLVGAIREAKMKAKHGMRTYFYLNQYEFPNFPKIYPFLEGTSHCHELPLLFGTYGHKDIKVEGPFADKAREYTEMLVHFVKYRVPKMAGKTLPRVTPHRVPYARIDNKGTEIVHEFDWERVAFWETLARKYGFDVVTGEKMPV